MLPYFKYIDYTYDRSLTKEIGQYCVDNFDKFMKSSSRECNKYGRYDYNYFLPRDHMCTDLMNKLGSKFKIGLTHEILGQDPFTDGKIHIDRVIPNVPPRISLVFFPIYPFNLMNVDSTNFYTCEEGEYAQYDDAVWKKQCAVDWSLGKPAILNLQQYHAAMNLRPDLRFAAQFTTALSFEQLCTLDEQGKLFHAD
jgi:hypothetical protein